jgi:hypothetical protein
MDGVRVHKTRDTARTQIKIVIVCVSDTLPHLPLINAPAE